MVVSLALVLDAERIGVPALLEYPHGLTGVDLVGFALLIEAEELGLTSANVDDMKAKSKSPAVRRILGLEGIGGKGLGLKDDWSYQVIKQVGNYGEVFKRNVGADSPLKIERGLNALWSKGGIMYAPPLR